MGCLGHPVRERMVVFVIILVTISLDAGTYYPFRVLFVNGYSYAGFKFSITSPDGKVLFNGQESLATQYFVPHGFGTTGQAFRASGKETTAP